MILVVNALYEVRHTITLVWLNPPIPTHHIYIQLVTHSHVDIVLFTDILCLLSLLTKQVGVLKPGNT